MSASSLMIKEEALRLGFDDCGISAAGTLEEDGYHLTNWLEEGFHADMLYMANNVEKRIDPSKLVDGVRSVVSVILNYFPSSKQSDPEAPVLSCYAYGKDYHLVIKEKLHLLLDFIKKNIPGTTGRTFVDSAPVLEHAWAQRSGLGWIGKNSLLLNSRFGSFIFIGELLISAELDYDSPGKEHCGTCRKCIDACPANAIVAERVVDARKCISYQTIENKGEMDPGLKDIFSNRVFGCDICQDVCPWNRKLTAHKTPEFTPHPGLLDMSEKEWHGLDQERFDEIFRDSAVQRIGFAGLRRNLEFIKV